MTYPQNYEWLADIKGLPRTIEIGLSLIGTKEVIGKGSNKTILSWRDELNQNGVKINGFSDDDIPWCGLFAAIVAFRRVGDPSEVVTSPLWARNWEVYGEPPKDFSSSPRPSLGDCMVFGRNGGGHVGFYVAEDASCYHILGGNQSNSVTITRIQKSRLLAARRPPYKIVPRGVKHRIVASTGVISTNEA